MGLMWQGAKVRDRVTVSETARRKGEGMAVYVGEETDVRGIMSRRAAKRESARLLNDTPGARTGGFFLVRRDADGDWRVV